MLLLTQDGNIVNLERMATIDTMALQIYAASLNVYARQGMGERGIILGSYNSESRCYNVIAEIYDEYAHGQDMYSMPKD